MALEYYVRKYSECIRCNKSTLTRLASIRFLSIEGCIFRSMRAPFCCSDKYSIVFSGRKLAKIPRREEG